MSFLLLSGEEVGTQVLTTSASAVLVGTLTRTTTADAYLQQGGTLTTSADAYLQQGGTLTTSANAVLLKTGITKTTAADAQLFVASATYTITTSASAYLVNPHTVSTSANAVLLRSRTASTQANALLYQAAGPGPSTPLAYQNDQQVAYQVEYWDTPFSPLYNNAASGGMRMDVYEVPSGFGTTFKTMSLAGWDAALDPAVLPNGRMPNAIGYWAGGAPGHHGVSVARQVAYRIQGTVRSAADRGWFSSASSFSMKFGVAGSGWMRITVNGTDVLPLASRRLTEADFLTNGPILGDELTLATGDTVVVYYVQDGDAWGGFVVKPVLPEDGEYSDAAYQDAPVLGCGLLEYGSSPAVNTLAQIRSIRTNIVPGQARQALIEVPLVAMATYDGVGWEWQRTNDETGFLRLHQIQQSDIDVRRQRLIRISLGYKSLTSGLTDLRTVFTGWTDDFEVRDGIVTIRCLGFEQRLADQFMKNYPDRVSYMSFGYRRLSGTIEPVYNVSAYDNWPIEFMFRDVLVRAGIDESRMRGVVKVRQANGGDIEVTM